jgi:hypothetical protein
VGTVGVPHRAEPFDPHAFVTHPARCGRGACSAARRPQPAPPRWP